MLEKKGQLRKGGGMSSSCKACGISFPAGFMRHRCETGEPANERRCHRITSALIVLLVITLMGLASCSSTVQDFKVILSAGATSFAA